MLDSQGRQIDYMRISITDKCNFRCSYCMPNGVDKFLHSDILSYEHILDICKIAVELGITKFKITGGEPFTRKNAMFFIEALKNLAGVTAVTITTNGALLLPHIVKLKEIGIDAINISLDSINHKTFKEITGFSELSTVLKAVEKSHELGITTKINTVILQENLNELTAIAHLAQKMEIDVRFIEIMPIGYGKGIKAVNSDLVLEMLKQQWSDLACIYEKTGNGPAKYYKSPLLKGRIGFISANSHKFCHQCNRIRLTSTGKIKPCLCYSQSLDLKELLDSKKDISQIKSAMEKAVFNKPTAHCFEDVLKSITEDDLMVRIGG